MTRILLTLFLASAAFVTLATSQETNVSHPLTFHVVATPGTQIGSHIFSANEAIYQAVINDSGNIAFAASDGLYTPDRVIAFDGEQIDDHVIVTIPSDGQIAVNSAGQVAYEAFYQSIAESQASPFAMYNPSKLGIFIENSLEVPVPAVVFRPDESVPLVLPHYTLTDDGRILLKSAAHAANPSRSKSFPSLNTGQLPKGIGKFNPFARTQNGKGQYPNVQQNISPLLNRPNCPPAKALPFPVNAKGQMLVPVNFDHGGFELLLAMPVGQ